MARTRSGDRGGEGTWLVRAVTIAVLLLIIPPTAYAQTASDRAGELKQWRERCSEYDVDVRTAYIEEAIAGADTSIIRICSRLALEADDADIRNLGLRAALASMDRLQFDVEIPEVLEAALKSAGSDRKKLDEIARWYIAQDWNVLQSGLIFEIGETDIIKGTAVLFAMPRQARRQDSYSGTSSIVGSRLLWIGRAGLAIADCKIDVTLQPGAELSGILHCGNLEPFSIRAKLL